MVRKKCFETNLGMEREVSDMGESLLDVCLYGELEDALEGVNSIFRFSKNYAKACIENV